MSGWRRRNEVDESRVGLLAEYADEQALLRAIAALRARGYRRLEAYVPFEVEGLDEALALPRSRIPWAALAIGFAGAAAAYALQWYCNAYDYPLLVGARPAHAPLAFVPITFETFVLATATAAFVGLLWRARLLRPWNALQRIDGFDRASVDRFFLAVDARDPELEPARTAAALAETSPIRIVRPAEAPA